MDLIKNKWKNYTAYRKLNNLWSDYKKIAQLNNDSETLVRFKKFLDQAHKIIQEYIDKNDNKQQIEELIGESTEVLSILFDYMSKYE